MSFPNYPDKHKLNALVWRKGNRRLSQAGGENAQSIFSSRCIVLS